MPILVHSVNEQSFSNEIVLFYSFSLFWSIGSIYEYNTFYTDWKKKYAHDRKKSELTLEKRVFFTSFHQRNFCKPLLST